MDLAQLSPRAQVLIDKGEAVLNTFRAPPSNFIGFEGWVDTTQFSEWQAQSLTFLTNSLGRDHVYTERFRNEVTEAVPSDTKIGIGVLRAYREDVEGGFLFELRRIVAAEVFSEFLDMAAHLCQAGYHHAAASLAGAVLEDSLRRAARAQNLKATGNLESLSQTMLDAGIYDALAYKQVKVWIAIRNSADHGEFEKVHVDDVDAMLRDLPSFLGRHLP
jgi:hypothetical protein